MIRTSKPYKNFLAFFAVLLCTVLSLAVLPKIQFVAAQEKTETKNQNEKSSVQKNSDEQETNIVKSVTDVKFVNITGKVIAPNEESLDGVSVRYAGLTDQGQCSSSGSACERDGTFSVRVFSNIDAFLRFTIRLECSVNTS